MQGMAEQEKTRQLSGFVQIDNAYLGGGERNGGKPGRGAKNKQPFLIAVSTDADLKYPTVAVIELVRAFDNASLADWVQQRFAPVAEAFTDGLGCFRRLEVAGHAHTVLQTGGCRAATEVDGARGVNVLLSNLKRALDRVYHAICQSKCAGRYLAEAAYRFKRRFNLRRMAAQLAADLMGCKPCPSAVLACSEQLRSLRFGAN